jgi:DNA polymerase III epsilon subunit family exonuclease
MKLGFIDTETTGLDPHNDRIVEIAVVIVDSSNLQVVEEYSSLVSLPPEHPFSAEAQRVNGITREMLASAPSEQDVFAKVATMLTHCTVVGHNVSFDLAFLGATLQRLGISSKYSYHSIDTVSCAFFLKLQGTVSNLKLTTLSAHFSIPHNSAHRALGDVHATIGVFRAIMNIHGVRFERNAHVDPTIAGILNSFCP